MTMFPLVYRDVPDDDRGHRPGRHDGDGYGNSDWQKLDSGDGECWALVENGEGSGLNEGDGAGWGTS